MFVFLEEPQGSGAESCLELLAVQDRALRIAWKFSRPQARRCELPRGFRNAERGAWSRRELFAIQSETLGIAATDKSQGLHDSAPPDAPQVKLLAHKKMVAVCPQTPPAFPKLL